MTVTDPPTTERREPCDGCGRHRRVTGRRPGGAPLCQTCHPKPQRPCSACGRTARVAALRDGQPICYRCYTAPTRRCGRCGQDLPIGRRATETEPDLCYACLAQEPATCSVCGRHRPCTGRSRGRPICQACTPRPARPCAACGRHRPVQAQWPMGPVCGACYQQTRRSPTPCPGCQRPRLLIAVDQDRRRVCAPCAGHPDRYQCRTCGNPGSTFQRDRCARCVLTSRLHDLLADPDGDIAPQLRPLQRALAQVDDPAALLGWVQRSDGARMLTGLARRGEPISHADLDRLPQTQPAHYLRRILVHTRVLPERIEHLERIEPWLERQLAGQPAARANLVRSYARWSVLHRARRRARRRTFTEGSGWHSRADISTALQLLTWIDEHNLQLTTLRQADLDRWLLDGTSSRQIVANFLAWTAEQRLTTDLTAPVRDRSTPTGFLDETTRWAALRRCLHDNTVPPPVRAAGALLLLYGNPVSRTVLLRHTDLHVDGEHAYLTLSTRPVALPAEVATLLAALRETAVPDLTISRSAGGTTWLLPGRVPGSHAAAGAIAKQLGRLGIPARAARNTALVDLAGDLPAAVLADLLGLSSSAATNWANHTKRNWTDYIAARTATTTATGDMQHSADHST